MNIRMMIGTVLMMAGLAAAQTPVSATWPLTANQSATVSGDITAPDQQLSGIQVSYSSSLQRSSPTPTAGAWVAEAGENTARYMQFMVSASGTTVLTVTSVSMNLYVNSGSNMRANVYFSKDSTFATRTQIGSTVTLTTAAPSVPNVSASTATDVNAGEVFYVRIYPWNTGATTGKYVITNTVKISGTTRSSIAVLTSVATLPQFLQTTSAPSAPASYSVSGTGLSGNVTITPPADFELSADSGTSWHATASPVVLNVNGGGIAGQPVTMRVRSVSAAAGLSTGVITHTSNGAPVTEVAVSAVHLAAEPTVSSAVVISAVTGSGMKLTFTGGNGARRVAVLRADSAVTWQPADAAPVDGSDSNFVTASDLGGGTKAVYDGTGTSVVVSGLSSNVKYYAAVFEYNVASGNSQNYRSDAGTASATTSAVPTLSVSRTSIAFGMVAVNATSPIQSLQVSAKFLSPASGSVTVTAPSGYSVSLSSNSGFSSSVPLPYTTGTLALTVVYVRFAPTALGAYDGTIAIAGGSAPNVTVSVSGTGASASVFANTPIGFATLNGGTTGGAGGPVTTVTNLTDLIAFAKSCENNTNPKVLIISGKISSSSTVSVTIKHGANISIYGAGAYGEMENVGLKIWDYKNVIVRNMKIHEVFYPEDAINIDACENVWIDHNELYSKIGPGITVDTYDGLLDIKEGSRYVTVSWNHLHHHMKCSLIGHTDNSGQQSTDSQMRITYHHNWFSDTDGRNPSIRFGAIHLFNNYFENISDYGIAARDGAHAKIENSIYHNVLLPMSTDKFPVNGMPNGYICESGNRFTGTSGANIISQSGCEFWDATTLPYAYTVDSVETVEGTVKLLAGVGIATTVEERNGTSPEAFGLRQNFPNPFNPSTTIQFRVEQERPVTLSIFNAIGQRMETLFTGRAEAGRLYSIPFRAERYASGIYFSVLESAGERQTKKLLLMK